MRVWIYGQQGLLSIEEELSPQHRKALAFEIVNCYFHKFRKNWAVYCPLFNEQSHNDNLTNVSFIAFTIESCISYFPDPAQPEFFKYYVHIG